VGLLTVYDSPFSSSNTSCSANVVLSVGMVNVPPIPPCFLGVFVRARTGACTHAHLAAPPRS
jgi:hypothetical protein